MLANAYQKYQSNSVLTASPAQLTLMLYNGAIKFCNLGIEAIQNRNIPEAHHAIIRAQDIILELRCTLDTNCEAVKEWALLYDYILSLLSDGNMQKNIQKIEEAKELIQEFAMMWQEIMKNAKRV